jgi:hypothetical protein
MLVSKHMSLGQMLICFEQSAVYVFCQNCFHDLTAWESNQVQHAQVTVITNYAFLVSRLTMNSEFLQLVQCAKKKLRQLNASGAPIGIINMCFDV